MLFILGNGSYFKLLKKFRYFFLEKKFAIYSYIYLANLILSSLFLDLNLIGKSYLINDECLEVFIYFILLLDTLTKRKIMVESLTS